MVTPLRLALGIPLGIQDPQLSGRIIFNSPANTIGARLRGDTSLFQKGLGGTVLKIPDVDVLRFLEEGRQARFAGRQLQLPAPFAFMAMPDEKDRKNGPPREDGERPEQTGTDLPVLARASGSMMIQGIGTAGPVVYEIIGTLGVGEEGIVRLGREVGSRELLVIKTIIKRIVKPAIEQVVHEVRVTRSLHHKAIPEFIEVVKGTTDDPDLFTVHLVTRHVPGSVTLKERIEKGVIYQKDEFVDLISQLWSVLDYAHGMKTVHRDLKPGNILVVENTETGKRTYYLIDFGIAKVLGDKTKTWTIAAGTPYYMAPEQRGEGGVIGAHTDLFGLGATLLTLLRGKEREPDTWVPGCELNEMRELRGKMEPNGYLPTQLWDWLEMTVDSSIEVRKQAVAAIPDLLAGRVMNLSLKPSVQLVMRPVQFLSKMESPYLSTSEYFQVLPSYSWAHERRDWNRGNGITSVSMQNEEDGLMKSEEINLVNTLAWAAKSVFPLSMITWPFFVSDVVGGFASRLGAAGIMLILNLCISLGWPIRFSIALSRITQYLYYRRRVSKLEKPFLIYDQQTQDLRERQKGEKKVKFIPIDDVAQLLKVKGAVFLNGVDVRKCEIQEIPRRDMPSLTVYVVKATAMLNGKSLEFIYTSDAKDEKEAMEMARILQEGPVHLIGVKEKRKGPLHVIKAGPAFKRSQMIDKKK
jgi:serine/threonine protein kinase